MEYVNNLSGNKLDILDLLLFTEGFVHKDLHTFNIKSKVSVHGSLGHQNISFVSELKFY